MGDGEAWELFRVQRNGGVEPPAAPGLSRSLLLAGRPRQGGQTCQVTSPNPSQSSISLCPAPTTSTNLPPFRHLPATRCPLAYPWHIQAIIHYTHCQRYPALLHIVIFISTPLSLFTVKLFAELILRKQNLFLRNAHHFPTSIPLVNLNIPLF